MERILEFISENKVLLGNISGFIGAVFAFISYQAKTPKKLLFYQTCLSTTQILTYAILGGWTGVAMNVVCVIRNGIYYSKKPLLFKRNVWAYILAAVLGIMGAISWEGPISLLEIIPLIVNTVVLSLGDNVKLRFSILFTSSSVLAYDLCVMSYMGAILEAGSIISSAIGLIRYRKRKK